MSEFQKSSSHFPWAMVLLVLACGFPTVAAWLYYFNPDFLPEKRSNYGKLVEPPYPLRNVHLVTAAGKDFRIEEVRGKWSMLWVMSQPRGDGQDSYLHRMHNLRVALRENSVRLQSIVIMLGGRGRDAWTGEATEFPDTICLTGSENELRDLAAQFATAVGLSTSQTDGFYLVDPLGNLMMRYDTNADFKGILKDLERLLKYSWVGR